MPNKKRQHFVPKYILRKFSADDDGRQIKLIHIRSKNFIKNAPIKGQCYKNYFYSKKESFEDTLSVIEGHQSRIINFIIENKTLEPCSLSHIALFITMQLLRTDMSRINQDALIEPLYKMILRDKAESEIPEDILRSIKIQSKYEVSPFLSMALEISPMIYDLSRVLIINKTKTPFVLSDHPVVVTNRFCRNSFGNKSGKGFALSGSQMFMPISPIYGIYLYDSGVYQVKNNKKTVSVRKEKDIDLFNKLQWINANESVYIPPEFPSSKIDDLMEIEGRLDKRVKFNRAEDLSNDGNYIDTGKSEYDAPDEDTRSEIVRMSDIPLPCDIKFSDFGMKQNKSYYNDGSLASPMRDPVWMEIINDYGSLFRNKKVKYSDVGNFITSHPLFENVSIRAKKNIQKYRI